MTKNVIKFQSPLDLNSLAQVLNQYPDFMWLDHALPQYVPNAHQGYMCFLAKNNVSSLHPNFNLKHFLNHASNSIANQHEPEFNGGWVGYVAYDYWQTLSGKEKNRSNYPEVFFNEYDTYFTINADYAEFHCLRPDANQLFEKILQQFLQDSVPPAKNFSDYKFTTSVSKKDYLKNVGAIKEQILLGDFYELNYTIPFYSKFTDCPLGLYFSLRHIAQAPMMAFLKTADFCVLSASPERFFCLANNQIMSEPIKGTSKRFPNQFEDDKSRQELQRSAKAKAELMMVTDLVKNDIAKVAKPNSTKVNQFAELKTFSHYHHLVSQIVGTAKTEFGLGDIFLSLFPGGSMTGAPKKAVLEAIQKYENAARGIYAGAVGYIAYNGTADFSMPIRTAILCQQQLVLRVGGGIVLQSVAEEERLECQIKLGAFLQALPAEVVWS